MLDIENYLVIKFIYVVKKKKKYLVNILCGVIWDFILYFCLNLIYDKCF